MPKVPPSNTTPTNTNPPSASPPRRIGRHLVAVKNTDADAGVDAAWDELELDPDDGRAIYRISALGDCTTALVARALQLDLADMPATLQPRLDEGKECEPHIIERFMDEFGYRRATVGERIELKAAGTIAGYNHVEQQVQVRMNVGKGVQIRGHCDEIATHKRADGKTAKMFYVVEAKAFGDSLWAMWKKRGLEGFPRYAWQVSGLSWATGLPVVVVIGHKDASGNDVSEIDVKVFLEPPFTALELKQRVLRAQRHVATEQLPLCDVGGWPCPVWFMDECQGKDKEEVEVLVDVELARLARLHFSYGVDERASKKARERVKAEIDKHVAEHGIARGVKYAVEDEAHNKFVFEWVEEPREGYWVQPGVRSYPKVTHTGEGEIKDAAEGEDE